MRRAAISFPVAALLLSGCPLGKPKPLPLGVDSKAPRLVVAERGPTGGRLVIVAEDGDRTANLTASSSEVVRDFSPAFSPDGRWIAFASSRERTFEESGIWIVAARPDAVPQRLTDTFDAIDLSP